MKRVTGKEYIGYKFESCKDLGYIFGLPERVIYLLYGNLYILDDYVCKVSDRFIDFEDLIKFIEEDYDICKVYGNKIDAYLADFYDLEDYIKENRKLLSYYKIKYISMEINGKDMKVKLIFEDHDADLLFGYYFRSRNEYSDVKILWRLLYRIVGDGDNGIKLYSEWLSLVSILGMKGIGMGWFRYIRVIGDKLVFRGNDWVKSNNEKVKYLISICGDKDKRYNGWVIDYDGVEGFGNLLELLGI